MKSPSSMSHEQLYLKIGDYIILKQSKYSDGRLNAEGIITDDIFLNTNDEYFQDSLWQIHVQNQYSAVREYEEVLFSTNYSDEVLTGSGSGHNNYQQPMRGGVTNDELISQLHRAAVNEGRLNEKLMAMKIGKPVAFGDVIQLRHVKSNKYLTVNSTTLARQERENLRVSLDSYGDPLSWLEFMPKSKGDREGLLISANSETLLRVHERPNEYIHCAKFEITSAVTQRKDREVNCSLETSNSCWSVSIYHHAQDVISKYILAGQMISLREPESSHYVLPNSDSNRVTISPSSILNVNSVSCTVGSHLLWIVEKYPLSRGGLIGSSRNDRIYLKHLNTGLFMRVESSSSVGTSMSLISTVRSREEASSFEVVVARENAGDDSIFQLCSRGMWLYASAPVQNPRSSSLLLSPVKSLKAPHAAQSKDPSVDDNNFVTSPAVQALIQAGRASPRRVSGSVPSMRSCAAVHDRALATYFSVSNNLQQELGVDLYLGVEAKRILTSFESVARSRAILKEPVIVIESRIKILFGVLESIFEFLTDDIATTLQFMNISPQQTAEKTGTSGAGIGAGLENTFEGMNKNSRRILIRQTLMREQGVLGCIIDLIELCGTTIFAEIPSTVRRLRDNPKGRTCVTREPSQNQNFKKLLSQMSMEYSTSSPNPHSNSHHVLATSSPSSDINRKSFTRLRTFSSEIIHHTSSGLPQGRRSNGLAIETSFRLNSFLAERSEDDNDDTDPAQLDQLVNDLGSLARDISTACFKALLAIIYENHSNQIYIADKFPLLLNQVKDQELAVVCVQEMLRDNLQMLQTKVREREIGIFLHLLEETEMNVTLLNLLRSTCSCPMGVDTTQRMVASALFQPLYNPNSQSDADRDTDPAAFLPHQLSALSDGSDNGDSLAEDPSEMIRQASSLSTLSEQQQPMDTEDKAIFARNRIISRAPRPSLLMMTPTTAYNKMRRSYVFTGAALRRSLLISLHLNPKIRSKTVEWSRNALYIPQSSDDCQSILAYSLVSEGLPRLTLSWEVGDDKTYSMMRVFNFSKEVPFETLCNVHAPRRNGKQVEGRTRRVTENSLVVRASAISRRASNNVRRTSRNTISGKTPKLKKNKDDPHTLNLLEAKCQIADYFCTQLYLLADLCLDRNYISMNFIELKFSYEMLLTILKLPSSPRRFKAPVCRLMRCLYIDRDPQIEIKYPRLIRTSLSLGGGNEIASSLNKETRNQFCLLQEILSDYIHNELETRRCDELSSEMLALLLSLMRFGFYQTIPQLKDVIFPLTHALDDHRYLNSPMTKTSSLLSNSTNRSLPSQEPTTPAAFSLWGYLRGKWGVSSADDEEENESEDGNGESFSFFQFLRNPSKWNGVAPDDGIDEPMSFSFSPPREQEIGSPNSSPRNRRTVRRAPSKSNRLGQTGSSTRSLSQASVSVAPEDITWEEHFLNHVESPVFICFIVILVIATTIIAVFNLIELPQGHDASLMTKADLVISIIFIVEISMRIYCTYVVYNDILTFLINPYKLLDVSVVALDVTLLAYGSSVVGLQGVSNFAKTLRSPPSSSLAHLLHLTPPFPRILRILRLIRLFRAARLIRKMTKHTEYHVPYTVPSRYSTPRDDEIRTLRGIIQILSVIHDRLQDQKLDSLISHFSSWFDDSIRNNSITPTEVYANVCHEAHINSTFPSHFGEILVDVLMYSDPALVQEALRLLMLRECHEGLFLETARRVQIIYSWRLENIYKNLCTYLKDLKIHAESFELWGNLATPSDHCVADAIISILQTIAEYLTRRHDNHSFDWENPITSDPEVQQLLFNMDAFNIFMLLLRSIAPQEEEEAEEEAEREREREAEEAGERESMRVSFETKERQQKGGHPKKRRSFIVDDDNNRSSKKIQAIIEACNRCICLFVEYHEVNQQIAFSSIDWFLSRVGDHCGSSKVARAIISGNRNLIKQCPRRYISELVQKIIHNGRRAEYLDLLIGMTDITDEGDSGIISLRSEISRYVTNRDRAQFLIEWCDAKDTGGYHRRKKAMELFHETQKPMKEIDLTPDLQYHLNLCCLLAGCKLGQKIQAVYPIEDLVDAIIDPDTITVVRRGLGMLLLEIVEDKLIGLDGSEAMWKLLEYCAGFYEESTDTLLDYFNKDYSAYRSAHADWFHITLLIITRFFTSFDLSSFRDLTIFENESSVSNTHRSEVEVTRIIETLYDSIKEFHKTHRQLIGPTLSLTIEGALETLKMSRRTYSSSPLLSPSLSPQPFSDTQQQQQPSELEYQSHIRNRSIITGVNSPNPMLNDRPRHRNLRKLPSLSADAIHEAFYRKQYHVFLDQISLKKEEYYNSSRMIFERMASVEDHLTSSGAAATAAAAGGGGGGGTTATATGGGKGSFGSSSTDVRLEPLLSKICHHIRHRLVKTDISVTLDTTAVSTSLWLVETWSLMIYKDLNLDVEQLTDPEYFCDIPTESRYQRIMNQNGVTVLCLELVAVGIEPSLRVAALKLLVALLVKNGGNREVQETISSYLSRSESMLFFEAIRDMIEQMMVWCQREAEKSYLLRKLGTGGRERGPGGGGGGGRGGRGNEQMEDLPEEVIVFKFLHSMCDGGYLQSKNLIREQTGNTRLVNLLDYFGYFLDLISRLESYNCTKIGIRVVHTILGLVQGPCKGNQEHFILHTNLLSASNRIMRSSQGLLSYSLDWENDLEILKERVIDVLLTCIEGNKTYGSVVFERIQIAMELNVLNVLIMSSDSEEFHDSSSPLTSNGRIVSGGVSSGGGGVGGGVSDQGNVSEIYSHLSPLQAKYLVFLKTLVSDVNEIPQSALGHIQREVLSVEVMWHSQPYTHYFPRPSVASDISESSKRRLIEEVDRSSQDTKLKDFIKIARDLHREATHHQILKGYGILNAWDLKTNLSWLMLLNCFIINVLLVIYFTTDPTTGVRSLPDSVDTVIFSLAIFQIFLSLWNLGIYIIVRVPVSYWSFIDDGLSQFRAIISSITEPVFLWSVFYVAISIMAICKSYLFLSICLLDFVVLDSTSRDVMYAVVYPARQLLTAIIIILIIVNVFAGFIFTFYGTDFDLSDRLKNLTLWDTMKLVITYGVRANEGIGAYMSPSISTRILLDMSFYLIVTVVLLNIFFGIIIDTFGKLRNLKVEREADTANKCFICGVDSHDFLKDGTSTGSLSFKQHREERHNLWNYLYFAMHLWQQPREKDSSVEMTVRSCIEMGDVSWFPIGFHEKTTAQELQQPGGGEGTNAPYFQPPPLVPSLESRAVSGDSGDTHWRHRPSLGRQSSNGSVVSLADGIPGNLSKLSDSLTLNLRDRDRDVSSADRALRAEFDRMTDLMTGKMKSLEAAIASLLAAQNITNPVSASAAMSPEPLSPPQGSPVTPILLQPLKRLQSFHRTSSSSSDPSLTHIHSPAVMPGTSSRPSVLMSPRHTHDNLFADHLNEDSEKGDN